MVLPPHGCNLRVSHSSGRTRPPRWVSFCSHLRRSSSPGCPCEDAMGRNWCDDSGGLPTDELAVPREARCDSPSFILAWTPRCIPGVRRCEVLADGYWIVDL